MSEAQKNKRAKKTILALRISSTIFMIVAILSFVIFASEVKDSIDSFVNVLYFFLGKMLAIGAMLLFGWLGLELDETADKLNRMRLRRIRELKAEGVI